MITKIVAIGGSYGIVFPRIFLEKKKLWRGDYISISEESIIKIKDPNIH